MYNGHPSYNAWNVALWIANEEYFYNLARELLAEEPTTDRAARRFVSVMADGCGEPRTPDGVLWTVTNVRRALRGMAE